ncbi:MAG: hypothetical protein WCA60_08985, partial [Methanoregula sp.]
RDTGRFDDRGRKEHVQTKISPASIIVFSSKLPYVPVSVGLLPDYSSMAWEESAFIVYPGEKGKI